MGNQEREKDTMLYTITSTLPPDHGGRTKALLKRIKFLYEELGIQQTILTTNYNIEYPQVLSEFRAQGALNSATEVINIYDWLSGFNLFNIPKTCFKREFKYAEQPVRLSGYTSKTNKTGDVVRYYDAKAETYLMYRKYFQDSDVVKFEDMMSPDTKHKLIRYEYNPYGYLHKESRYAAASNIKVSETLYDLDGNAYCQKFFETSKPHQAHTILLLHQGRITHSFKSDKALFAYFYNALFKDGDIVFNDARLLDRPLLDTQHDIKRLMVFHSTHLTEEGNIKGSFKTALLNPQHVAYYLVLTEQQKADILAETDVPKNQIAVMPHFIEASELKEVERKDQFVYLGRFSKEKQIDHIVKAFKTFKDNGYSTKLKLYGAVPGAERDRIEQCIKDNQLETEVEIKSFTSDPNQVFRESLASFLTSTYEGFGLAMMESINEGCPVIAYDVRYGPNEVIIDGENGYLIEPNNIKQLAQAMMQAADQPLKAVHTREKLTPEAAKNNFEALFQALVK